MMGIKTGDRMGERIKMMKPAIAIPTAILVSVLATGLASAQNPSIIQNTRNTMNEVSNQQKAASNQALGVQQSTPPASSATHSPVKPHPGASSKAPAKPPVKTPSSTAAVAPHVAEARVRHHSRRHWVNGVLVEEPG